MKKKWISAILLMALIGMSSLLSGCMQAAANFKMQVLAVQTSAESQKFLPKTNNNPPDLTGLEQYANDDPDVSYWLSVIQDYSNNFLSIKGEAYTEAEKEQLLKEYKFDESRKKYEENGMSPQDSYQLAKQVQQNFQERVQNTFHLTRMLPGTEQDQWSGYEQNLYENISQVFMVTLLYTCETHEEALQRGEEIFDKLAMALKHYSGWNINDKEFQKEQDEWNLKVNKRLEKIESSYSQQKEIDKLEERINSENAYDILSMNYMWNSFANILSLSVTPVEDEGSHKFAVTGYYSERH